MWKGKSISVVMATYKEKDSVRATVDDFLDTGVVDEIIIISNNSEPGTKEELAKVKTDQLTILDEPRQGYGYAIAAGLLAATGDYILTAEPDGTYTAKDLKRFLVFAEDFKVVLGSRAIVKTKNKDWGFWRRHANIVQGLMISFLFRTNTITDVGCLYRLFHKDVISKIKGLWNTRRLFATDVLIHVVEQKIPFVEIAVTFKERIGLSTMLGGFFKLIRYGVAGLVFIFERWIKWFFPRFRNLFVG